MVWLIILLILVFLLVFLFLLWINAMRKHPEKPTIHPVNEKVDKDLAAKKLSDVVQFKTIAQLDRSKTDYTPFDQMLGYLEKAYPLTHANLTVEMFDYHSPVYHWKGSNESLDPIGLMAHMDVVPVNENEWKHKPFGGEIEDGYVYGRGTLDMKGQMISIFESVESLLSQGFSPKRSIYLIFGTEEEPSGGFGPKEKSKAFQERGMHFYYILDEGGAIQDGNELAVPGTVALLGICEKGVMNVKLTAHGRSGHASMPPEQTAVGNLARAIAALEQHPMKGSFNYATEHLFDILTPHMKGKYKFLFGNRWLFQGLLIKQLMKSPVAGALFRSTFAPTQLYGSNAENVLADRASAIINIRIAPGETDQDILAHIKQYTKDIDIETLYYYPPSPISYVDTKAYGQVSQAVQDVFSDMIVAPFSVVTADDARFFQNVCDDIYRFNPFPSIKDDLATIHGKEERLKVDSLKDGITFFIHLIKESCG